MDNWEKLKQKIISHHYALDDAPYFGWSKEFINGFYEALKRIEKDMKQIEKE